jgi:hypothetical protein
MPRPPERSLYIAVTLDTDPAWTVTTTVSLASDET